MISFSASFPTKMPSAWMGFEYPPIRYPVGTVTEGSAVTLYHETSSAEEILSRLRDLTRDEPDKSDLRELASRGVLAPFARLETRRRSYRKGEVSIVVDATDWGYRCVDGFQLPFRVKS